MSTRLVRDHEEWVPWGYQRRSVTHLLERRAAALFLDPGLGKTAVVLEAFRLLKEANMVRRMLVVAPLRVCQLVWEQEGRKWTQFRELTFTLLHGPKKSEKLKERTDIHLINPEGIAWLSQEYYGRTDLPYDIITIDELPKFKNARAQRSKKLRKKLPQIRYRWGLTGSPAPNGYMDLFGQMLLLDDGAALGRFITHFRDRYFERDYDGFSYKLKSDGAARIEEKIAPYVLRMSAADYLSLPPLTDNIINIELSKEARKQYTEMKKEMIISLPEGTVTAANSAAVYTKLAQLANGAVYVSENEYAEVHTAKLDALEDLVEELAGQPLLVGYQFQHDLARLQERFPKAPTLTGLSHKKIVELEAAWNAGEIPLMFAHPASAGHGLNLQGAGASHVCWFSRPWDLDLYDQFIRRLLRQGTTAQHIMNHALVVKDSIDEIIGDALRDKDVTQQRLLTALNAEVIRDVPITVTHNFPPKEDMEMALKKLGFQGQQNAAGAPGNVNVGSGAAVQPRGWGAPAQAATETAPPAAEPSKTPRGWGAPGTAHPDAQREAINSKLRAPEPEPDTDEDEAPASSRAMAAFGGLVQPIGAAEEDAAAGAVQPRGWGNSPKQDTEPAADAEPPAQDTEKRPTRSRRSSKPASDATQEPGPAEPAGGAVNRAPYAPPAVDREVMRGGVRIELTGLPPATIAVALAAIAASLREGPA